MTEYRREELINILERAVVPHEKWRDRDTSDAQRQAGEALFLLKAGCPFKFDTSPELQSNRNTIWIEIQFHGFAAFDHAGSDSAETYYLPTPRRLDAAAGDDWY